MFSGKIEDYILFEDKEIIVCRKPQAGSAGRRYSCIWEDT